MEEGGRSCGLRRAAQEGWRMVGDAAYGCPAHPVIVCMTSVSMFNCEPACVCRSAARRCSDRQNGVFIHHKGAVREFVFIYAGLQSGKGVELLTVETGVVRAVRRNGHGRPSPGVGIERRLVEDAAYGRPARVVSLNIRKRSVSLLMRQGTCLEGQQGACQYYIDLIIRHKGTVKVVLLIWLQSGKERWYTDHCDDIAKAVRRRRWQSATADQGRE